IDGRPAAAGDGGFAGSAPAKDRVDLSARAVDGRRAARTVALGACVAPTEVADVMAPGGKRRVDEDVGAPFRALVTPGAARTLSFAGATLEIPKGAVDRDVRVTIRPLGRGELRPMNNRMDNVTDDGRGYRFGPRGMVFKKPVKITLPYDPARLPGKLH